MGKPRTIAQYCIQKWLESNFHMSSLQVIFNSDSTARIVDCSGEVAIVVYTEDGIYLEENECIGVHECIGEQE